MKKLSFYIVVVSVLILFGTAFAGESVVDQYSAAMKQSREGDANLAVEMLMKIALEHPDHHIADDALFQAGNIAEKKLGLYDKAQQAYLRVLEKYPKSKNARRARKRYEYLVDARRSGDEPLQIYTQVMQNLPRLGLEKGLEMMIDLYERFPAFNRRDQVLYWIAENKRRLLKYDEAVEYYNALIKNHPDSKWAYFSMEKMGQVYVELRDFDKAIEIFQKLPAYESRQPGAIRASVQLIDMASRFQFLRRMFHLAIGIVLVALIGWGIGTKWKKIDKTLLRSGLADVICITSFVVLGFYFAFKDTTPFVAAYWIVVAIAIPGTFVFHFVMNKSLDQKKQRIKASLWFTYRALFLITAGFGMAFILLSPTLFRTTVLYFGFCIGLAAFLNHLFIMTNNFNTAVKVILGFSFFLVSTAIVYGVYYQSDVVNLLYDSIMYGRKAGGGGP